MQAVAQKQKITNTDGEDKDIIALARDERDAVVQVFFIRSGKLIGRDHFYLRIADGEEAQNPDLFRQAVLRGNAFIPREMMLPQEIEEEQEVIAEWLAKRKGQQSVSAGTTKRHEGTLVELAKKNARMVLRRTKSVSKRRRQNDRCLKRNRRLLELDGIKPRRGL